MEKEIKIYINRKPVTGPWGGGNKTLQKLCDSLNSNNFKVCFDLEPNIDIIFCFDPRPDNKGIWYQHFIDYKNKYKDCKIIQRVGDVGTHSKPELTILLKQIVKIKTTDFFIFPSEWAKKFINVRENYKIVENKPLKIFYKNRKFKKQLGDKIKIVTHHWSTNQKKGFDVYNSFCNEIQNKNLNYEFTFIGRTPGNFKPNNCKIIAPISKDKLSEELPKYDIYFTASLEEAGANHVLEAMAAGLPIVYRKNGGSINEYCKEYGIEYESDYMEKINYLVENYELFLNKMKLYNKVIDSTIEEYISLIKEVVNDKNKHKY